MEVSDWAEVAMTVMALNYLYSHQGCIAVAVGCPDGVGWRGEERTAIHHRVLRVNDELTPSQYDALLNEGVSDWAPLAAFLHERIRRWPWWDCAWTVVTIQQVQRRQINDWLHTVTIDGLVGRGAEETLPLSVFVRVAGPRLDRFEVRVGDALIGPPIRHSDPHPFGSIFSALMDRRGISREEMAFRCKIAESTVAKMRAGYLVPRQRDRVADLAAALEMPVGDLMAIAGLPEDV
jgi:hypothetical protein